MQGLDFLEKMISDFTVRRVAVILVALTIAILAVVSYELTTSHFELERYSRATALLKDLDALSQSENQSVRATALKIAGEVDEILNREPVENSLYRFEHRMALALIMGVPWVVLSFLGIVEAFRKVPDWEYAFFGCLFFAVVYGGAGYYIPTDIHWFFRYLVIPILAFGVVLAIFYTVGDDDEDGESV